MSTALPPPFDPWQDIKQKFAEFIRGLSFLEMVGCVVIIIFYLCVAIGAISGN